MTIKLNKLISAGLYIMLLFSNLVWSIYSSFCDADGSTYCASYGTGYITVLP